MTLNIFSLGCVEEIFVVLSLFFVGWTLGQSPLSHVFMVSLNKRRCSFIELQDIWGDFPLFPGSGFTLEDKGETIFPFNSSGHISIFFQVWLMDKLGIAVHVENLAFLRVVTHYQNYLDLKQYL